MFPGNRTKEIKPWLVVFPGSILKSPWLVVFPGTFFMVPLDILKRDVYIVFMEG